MVEKVKKTSSKSKEKEEIVVPTFQEIRLGIAKELSAHFKSDSILVSMEKSEETITGLMEDFKRDFNLPMDLDLLLNFNMGLGDINARWLSKYSRHKISLTSHENKQKALENKIYMEYKFNPEYSMGRYLNEKELKSLYLINPEYIELTEKINHLKAILSVIEMAIEQMKNLNWHVKNTIDIIKIKNNMQW